MVSIARELRSGAGDERPLVLLGQPGLVSVLQRELVRDGVAAAVREGGDPEGAAAIVFVFVGEATADDVALLRRADRARVPAVAVITSPPAGTFLLRRTSCPHT